LHGLETRVLLIDDGGSDINLESLETESIC
jgi:hypothetical protein